MKKITSILLSGLLLSSCGPGQWNGASNPKAEGFPDYAAHTCPDEKAFKTTLGDLSQLSQGKRVLATKVPVADWSGFKFEGFMRDEVMNYDMRSRDISDQDLSVVTDYNELTFDSNTKWPAVLPQGFDPEYLLEYNQNPGLGIRKLHDQGITGKNVGVAIIDQALLLDHEQYKDNLMLYEQIHCADHEAQMHGPAVASIAVGKTVGVAPGAKLYYIAETHGHLIGREFEFDATIIADSILRILEANRHLPQDQKIRVISISRGFGPEDKGYDAMVKAIDQADKENIFVITTSTEQSYPGFFLHGMDRAYLQDPDDVHSYSPAGWVTEDFYQNPDEYQSNIWFPMGSRSVASCTGAKNYELSYAGGLSWAVPWCAGFYALCCEVKPEITPGEFIQLLQDTSETVELVHEGKSYQFGKIVNPQAAVERLQK